MRLLRESTTQTFCTFTYHKRHHGDTNCFLLVIKQISFEYEEVKIQFIRQLF